MVEKVETQPLKVENVVVDGGELVITLTSSDREALTENGRQFVVQFVTNEPKYSSWAMAGVDKASGPAAFDPANENRDPYAKDSQKVHWQYRQVFRLTKML
jgi:hypothetical protein